MKRTEGSVAHQIEGVLAVEYDGFEDRHLYVLDGKPGLYRKLKRTRGKPSGVDGAVMVLFVDELIDLKRVPALEAEFAQAGYTHGNAPLLPAHGVFIRGGDVEPAEPNLLFSPSETTEAQTEAEAKVVDAEPTDDGV